MAVLNLLIAEPTGVWPTIIGWFTNSIASYAWAIIVLTLVIKVVMSPLDFFNKKINRDNMKVQAVLQPEMAKLQQQYGNNPKMLEAKKAELYKKHSVNMTGACVFMLINFVITCVVFFTLFASLNNISSYKIQQQYLDLRETYTSAYTEILDGRDSEEAIAEATAGAQASVVARYDETKYSFLWIENVWVADAPWASSIPSFDDYIGLVGGDVGDIELDENGNPKTYSNLSEENQALVRAQYEEVMDPLREARGRVNGYLILPILSILTAFLSQWLAQVRTTKKMAKKGQQAQPTNKVMLIVLPLIMGIFTLFYNSIFALYIIVGQIVSIATAPLIDLILDKWDDHKDNKKKKQLAESSRGYIDVDYRRK